MQMERQLFSELRRSEGDGSWQGPGPRLRPPRAAGHVRGMRDIRRQQSIPHLIGERAIFQRLGRLARERETSLKRARLWISHLRREYDTIAQVDRERALVLKSLEPRIKEELKSVLANPSASSPKQGGRLEY